MSVSIIGSENFQEFNIYDNTVLVRYRIVSEDRNNRSYWSPIYKINPDLAFVPGDRDTYGNIFAFKNSSANFFQVSWDSISIYKDNIGLDKGRVFPSLSGYLLPKPNFISKLINHDVWIRWSDSSDTNYSNWINKERASSTSIALPDSLYTSAQSQSKIPKFARIEIYRPGIPVKRYSPDVLVIDSTTTSNTVSKIISFSSPHNITEVKNILYYASYTSGSFITNNSYWIAPITSNSIAFYASESDAQSDINRITPPTTLAQAEILFKTFTQNSSSIIINDNIVNINNHGFSSGDGIVYRALNPAGGVTDEQLLWVRIINQNSFRVYKNYFETRDYSINSQNIFSNTGSGLASFSRYPFLMYKTKISL